jgi:hypothetical protein
MMEQSNYVAVAEGLKHYLDGMRRFARERLFARYDDQWWEKGVLAHLYFAQRDQLQREAQRRRPKDNMDVIGTQQLVFIVSEEIDGAFAGYFSDSRKTKTLLQLVADTRNESAHPDSGDFSQDAVELALNAMEQILTSARVPEASKLHLLRMQVSNTQPGSTRRLPKATPASRDRDALGMGDVIQDTSNLAAKDVAGKRVLCPACEAFVFQMWPGGWDGHSGWKCAGLTASDPEERKREFRTRYAHLFRRR